MGQTKILVVVAGAALSMSAGAWAQGGGNYGTSGFTISDASGDNTLTIGGAAKFRYNMSFRDEDFTGINEDFTQGFSTPLTRVRFSGHVGSRDFTYKVQLTAGEDSESSTPIDPPFDDSDFAAIGSGTADFSADDVYGEWNFGNGWSFRWGQFNLPVLREVMIGAESNLGSDFSIVSQFFGQGYSQGVQVSYGDEQMRFMGAWSDGVSSAGTPFDFEDADFAISLRLEGLVQGSGFGQFNNYSSWNSTQGDNILVGGAFHYEDGGETGGTTDGNLMLYTIDAQWEGPGYTVSGAFVGSNVEVGSFDRSDFGVMVQGGYFFTESMEGFARVDMFFLDSDAISSTADDNVFFLTVGGNYYPFIESNALKFTAQLGYSFSDPSGLGGAGRDSGFLGQATDGEVALQFQGQWIF